MKKILITGASGFVGQHLISLLKDKYQIIGLSNNQIDSAFKNVHHLMGDIQDRDFLAGVFSKFEPEAIINLAGIAQTHHIEADLLFKVNFFGIYSLLETIKNLKIKTGYSPKILHISSSDIYGKTTNPGSISEDSVLNPVNYYGVSKLAGDRLAYQYSQSERLNIAIFRPFPHIGPGQKKGFFVPDMVSQIVEIEKDPQKNEIKVGNLDAIRDYLDVRDVVRLYGKVVEKYFEMGESFNICSGNGIRVGDLLDKLISFSSKKIRIVQDPDRMRPSEVPILVGDPKKVKKNFSWQPEINIDLTLKETLESMRLS